MAEQIHVSEGEAYPIYFVNNDGHGTAIEVPDGFTERLQAAAAEWWECQEILEDAYEVVIERRRRELEAENRARQDAQQPLDP